LLERLSSSVSALARARSIGQLELAVYLSVASWRRV
jgi:hypothetical protein